MNTIKLSKILLLVLMASILLTLIVKSIGYENDKHKNPKPNQDKIETVNYVSLNVIYINGETETIDFEYTSPCSNDIDIRLSDEGCIVVVSSCIGANEILRPACGVRRFEINSLEIR